ncbi:hypothetical protein I4F81_003732 [Pyropia yezoensis]|uniref:Uncharacterized protein n=1 Tax=Pyropia yezoensis TaxID=2788 RepID=A0ACC3BU69_PYRYE|nr:hypothetical protein I4F81_003732 [Neopyropia yezoensis]
MARWALLLASLVASGAVGLANATFSALPATAGPALPSWPPRVVRFWLVNATTGVWAGRPLRDGDVIPAGVFSNCRCAVAVDIAALSSAGRRYPVVLVSPAAVAHTEYIAPYIAGVDEGGVVGGLRLPLGAVTVSTYVEYLGNSDGRRSSPPPPVTTIRLMVVSPGGGSLPTPCPLRGVSPVLSPSPSPPLAMPPFGRTERGGPRDWYFYVYAAVCAGTTARVTVYAIEGEDEAAAQLSVSEFLFVSPDDRVTAMNPHGPGHYFRNTWMAPRGCGSRVIFATVCVVQRGTGIGGGGGYTKCVRSPDVRMPAAEPRRLVLDARPPWVLALAPGDAATVVATVPTELTMVGVARSADGSVCRTPAVTGQRLEVEVPTLTGGVPAAANGTVVSVEYASPECWLNVGSSEEVANTTLLVSADVDPLVKKDARHPSAVVVTYPATPSGAQVNLSVAFFNNGGGRRRDRTTESLRPTELHYQWLVDENRYTGQEPPPLTALAGETGPPLRLAEAWPGRQSCNRVGALAPLATPSTD